jgi:hypothetical protein
MPQGTFEIGAPESVLAREKPSRDNSLIREGQFSGPLLTQE